MLHYSYFGGHFVFLHFEALNGKTQLANKKIWIQQVKII
jgi:hypothetical protein